MSEGEADLTLETATGDGVPGVIRQQPVRTGFRDSARRAELRGRGRELIAKLVASGSPEGANGPATADPNEVAESAAGVEAAGPDDVDEDATTAEARLLWERFLGSLYESPYGGFAQGDMFLGNEEAVLDYFTNLYAQRFEKGLVLTSRAWARGGPTSPPVLNICWYPSNSTNAERARIQTMVTATWDAVSDTVFDFTNSTGGFNDCTTTTDTWEIRIFQDSTITRGCSFLGNASVDPAITDPLDCGGGSHPTASILLRTGASATTQGADHLDYSMVHEFGHAIGLMHEQIRLEYDWRDPDDPVPPPASLARNCPSADGDITYVPDGLFLNDRLVPADFGALAVGAFDDNSIMYYCHVEEDLVGSVNDPLAKLLSQGDIMSSRNLYSVGVPNRQFTYRHSSWFPTSIQLAVQLNSIITFHALSSQGIPQVISPGNRSGAVGDPYTVTALAPGDPRLKCTAFGGANDVYANPAVVPPAGFDADPVAVTCYHPAGLSHVVASGLL